MNRLSHLFRRQFSINIRRFQQVHSVNDSTIDSSTASTSLPSSSHFEQVLNNSKNLNYKSNDLPSLNDPLLDYLAKLLMKDGKKARSQSYLNKTLDEIKVLTRNTTNPLTLLRNSIILSSPSFRLSSSKRNNKVLHTPLALTERQSIRIGFKTIVNISDKRNEKFLHQRLAREVLNVLDHSSDALKRKEEIHKVGTLNRSNLVQALNRR